MVGCIMPEGSSKHASLQATRGLSPSVPVVDDCALPDSVPRLPQNSQAVVCKADILRDDLTGLALGPYALGEKIGGGGMGKIFAARHLHLEKDFAIKFIASVAVNCPEARSRFTQEVKTLGKLQHPHIVSAVDAGCVEGMQYLVTERIIGRDLAQIISKRSSITVADACELVRQAAQGLAYSHTNGVVHRDIKPSNLFLDRMGVVKILDFGLVRSTNPEHSLTIDGATLGTLDFISPEQAQDARIADPRSDIYSLGCTLLFLLSGRVPFHGECYATPAAKIKGHLLDLPDWLSQPPAEVPGALLVILRKMLAKNPNDRYAAASEIAGLLEPLSRGNQVTQLLSSNDSQQTNSRKQPEYSRKPARRMTWVLAATVNFLFVGGGISAALLWGGAATPQPESKPMPSAVASDSPTTPSSSASLRHVETDKTSQTVTQPSHTNPREPLSSAPQTTSNANVTHPTKETANASAIQFEFSAGRKKINVAPFTGSFTKPE